MQIRSELPLECPLRVQDEFAQFAHGAVSAAFPRDIVRVAPYRGWGLRHRHGQSAAPEYRQIEDVVAHVSGGRGIDPEPRQEVLEGRVLVGGALVDQIDAETLRAQLDAARLAAGDEGKLNAACLEHFHAVAIAHVECLQLLTGSAEI